MDAPCEIAGWIHGSGNFDLHERAAAMAHERANDDPSQIRQALVQTTGPARYVFARPVPDPHTRARVPIDPRASTQGMPVSTCKGVPLVDVDSDLIGITRRYGKCSDAKYDPRRNRLKCDVKPLIFTRGVATPLDTEDCRLQNPPCTLRGTGINRFQWLCEDPQNAALQPFSTAIDYRTIAKDNHHPLIETPLVDAAVPPKPCVPEHAFGSVKIGRDIAAAVASYPALPTTVHWRDADEVSRIQGKFNCSKKRMCGCTMDPCSREFD